ncbi:MAG: HAD-IIB family hydrolase [Clostridia bacterium]|nr:HAD-IIB family hydrolase [Clostridia bacterium]
MKIIASDYDGTFNRNGIDENKRDAVSRWRNAGNLFGIISGRGYPSLKEVVDRTPFEYDFLVCNNGAVIYNDKEEIIFEIRCDGAYAKPLIRDMFKWGCPMANIDKESPVTVKNSNNADDCEYTLATLPEITYFNQISTYLDAIDEATQVVKKIEGKYSDILTPLQNGTCIDIVPKGVNKAQGIYSLLENVGATYSDVIAVGDNINDTHMIAEFRSYAMDNAVDSIKELADYMINDITEIFEKEL